MQAENTGLTAKQISLVVDTLQAEVEQASRSLQAAQECAKTIECAADHGGTGSRWEYVAEAAHDIAENTGFRGGELDLELAGRRVDALRDLVELATSRNDPLPLDLYLENGNGHSSPT